MSLTVPFPPLRLGSDDVGEDRECFLMYVVVVVVFWERAGGFSD